MSFVTHYNLQLKPSEADDYTLLPPGTYTHKTLPYGPIRLGIRRGDVAYVATEGHGVVEVHLSNMSFHPDSATPYRGSGKPPVATAKPSSRKGQPAKEFAVGDIVKDEFGTKHVVDEANIDRLRSLLGKLDFTYVK